MEVMSLDEITPDQVVLWEWGMVKINETRKNRKPPQME
jgi:hypothetical protein